MKYRRLGKTDLKVSVVGVGTWQFGGDWGKDFKQSEVDAILDKAQDVGINLIDTAECYGPHHLSESFIGDYLSRHNREDWVIASKFGHHWEEEWSHAWKVDDVNKQLDDSLKALQTDYIDLYQFHSGADEDFDNDDLWTMLDKEMQAGKIRNLGISIGSNQNIYQTKQATDRNASAIQVVYNRLQQEPEDEVFPSCLEQDLGVLARVPLASGFLSGKYHPGVKFEDKVRSRRDQEEIDIQLKMVEQIKAREVPEGVDMAKWALAWCLKHDAVSCVIPGCKSPEQVEMNAAAADLDIVSDDHPSTWK
ncbi:aldo/keto reductase [Saliterribacillus persicus]|uniref:Aryl-alcohol dehydrogenase-like predicted oxidoreductase n=1 Tax=Saliterribacillus persicus TaxID=930114 RepID=A0A368YDB2_9BACI|nr:aldo/keto reductase [Saliterribacillus persicus]RCW77326.1 aryl-alcohol dehydrogenase-like predicted oxidoreductase [Saliterribacillus persicus]